MLVYRKESIGGQSRSVIRREWISFEVAAGEVMSTVLTGGGLDAIRQRQMRSLTADRCQCPPGHVSKLPRFLNAAAGGAACMSASAAVVHPSVQQATRGHIRRDANAFTHH